MSFARIRQWLWRIGISTVAAAAFGCFGLVAGMLPAFVYEKAVGTPAPESVIALLALLGATAGGLWGFLPAWRSVGSEPRPPRPRRSLRDRFQGIVRPEPPPWEKPRTVDWLANDEVVREQLVARLDLVPLENHDPIATRTEYFRDRYTGQLWQSIYCEQGFGSGYAYAPIDKSQLPT